MNLRSTSIRIRLILLAASALIVLGMAAAYFMVMQRDQMITDRRAKLTAIIEMADNTTKH